MNLDKRKLAEEINEFEKRKELERKKSEEEKRRMRRDKMLMEKAKKEKKNVEVDKNEEKARLAKGAGGDEQEGAQVELSLGQVAGASQVLGEGEPNLA